jgi:L-alanine-DL-glutamate epimerase-like enolase superfamily enzyme
VALGVAAEYSDCGVKLENGYINISEDPGLGVTIDEVILNKFVTEHIIIK